MVDLKDLLNVVKPKDDGKKGGLDDLIGGAIDAISGDSKKGGLDDLIGGAISSLTGNKDDVKETKSSDKNDGGGLDDLIGNALSSLTGGGNVDMITKILKGALTSKVLTDVIKTFTSNLTKKPDVVDNLTASLESNDVEPDTVNDIIKSVMDALNK
ncbi:MAG: hypothetical protein GX233_01885 [Erysipelothrix sp.]|nr:hypothetical protein [Erysipelothrix sp.]